MRAPAQSRNWFVLLAALAGACLTFQACQPAPQSPTQEPPAQIASPANPETMPATPESGTATLLPPPQEGGATTDIPMPLMGAEIRQLGPAEKLGGIARSGMTLVRYNSLRWSEVEPNEGERRWARLQKLEQGLADASAAGLKVILIVRSTPTWAQANAGYFCGPIKEDKLQSFANFMTDIVARYSAPPYNVKYWELWNEPDVDPQFVQPESVFGCWGDESAEMYAGDYYAEMLKAVYPAIKAADPEAEVLIGGLLLDCDPSHPPEGKTCYSSNFLEGILSNGGGDYFDVVSFHGYPPYAIADTGGGLQNDVHFPPWEARGGVVLGKIGFIREVLGRYGFEKAIMHTEGSLICPDYAPKACKPPGEAFFDAQADYVVWLFIRNWAEGLEGTIWYQYEGPGWLNGSIAGPEGQSKPALQAFEFLAQELAGATFTRKIEDYPGLEAFEFAGDQKKVQVLWSPDGQAYSVTLPPGTLKVLDKYGSEILVENDLLDVMSPVYVELAP